MGILVLNYINNIIGIAPNDLADLHFSKTLHVLHSLGFILNNSITVPPTSVAVCLGITFNIKIWVLLALLRDMGDAPQAAIDEGTHQDLRWFIACAHAVNGTVSIFKCLRPRLDLFVDASLQGLGGPSVLWFTGLHCPPVLGGA
jgi:hypothetical protein